MAMGFKPIAMVNANKTIDDEKVKPFICFANGS